MNLKILEPYSYMPSASRSYGRQADKIAGSYIDFEIRSGSS